MWIRRGTGLILVLIVVLRITEGVDAACPYGCQCDQPWYDDWWSVTCTYITHFPSPLPKFTRSLFLSLGGFPGIPERAFSGKRGIQTLEIEGSVGEIDSTAFDTIDCIPHCMDSRITIKNANITKVHTHSFKGLKNYKLIEIKDSSIGEIFNEAFTEFRNVYKFELASLLISTIHGKAISNLAAVGLNKLNVTSSIIDSTWGYPFFNLRVPYIHLTYLNFRGQEVYDHILSEIYGISYLEVKNIQFPMDWGKGLLVNATGAEGSELYITNFQTEMFPPSALSNIKSFDLVELLNCNFNSVKDGAFNGIREIGTFNIINSRLWKIEYHAFYKLKYIRTFHISGGSVNSIYGDAFHDLKNIDTFIFESLSVDYLHEYAFHTLHHITNLTFRDLRVTTMESYSFKDFAHIETLTFSNFQTLNLVSKAWAYWREITNVYIIDPNIDNIRYDSICQLEKIDHFVIENPTVNLLEGEAFLMVGCLGEFRITGGTLSQIEGYAFKGITNIGTFAMTSVNVPNPHADSFALMKNIINFDVVKDRNNFPAKFTINAPTNNWVGQSNQPSNVNGIEVCYPSSTTVYFTTTKSSSTISSKTTISTTKQGTAIPSASSTMTSSPRSTNITTSTTQSPEPSPGQQDGFPLLYIILAGVGGAVVIIILVLIILCIWCIRRRRKKLPEPPNQTGAPMTSLPHGGYEKGQDRPAGAAPSAPPRDSGRSSPPHDYLPMGPDTQSGRNSNHYDYIDDRNIRERPDEGQVNRGYEMLDSYTQPQNYYQGLRKPMYDNKS